MADCGVFGSQAGAGTGIIELVVSIVFCGLAVLSWGTVLLAVWLTRGESLPWRERLRMIFRDGSRVFREGTRARFVWNIHPRAKAVGLCYMVSHWSATVMLLFAAAPTFIQWGPAGVVGVVVLLPRLWMMTWPGAASLSPPHDTLRCMAVTALVLALFGAAQRGFRTDVFVSSSGETWAATVAFLFLGSLAAWTHVVSETGLGCAQRGSVALAVGGAALYALVLALIDWHVPELRALDAWAALSVTLCVVCLGLLVRGYRHGGHAARAMRAVHAPNDMDGGAAAHDENLLAINDEQL